MQTVIAKPNRLTDRIRFILNCRHVYCSRLHIIHFHQYKYTHIYTKNNIGAHNTHILHQVYICTLTRILPIYPMTDNWFYWCAAIPLIYNISYLIELINGVIWWTLSSSSFKQHHCSTGKCCVHRKTNLV